MARGPFHSLTAAPADPPARQNRLSREFSRLATAFVLLLIAALSSALAGDTAGDRAPRQPALAIGAGLFRGFSAPLRPASISPASVVAELQREDRALRLLAGTDSGFAVDLASLIRGTRLEPFSWREAEDSLLKFRDRLEFTPSIMPARGYISSGFNPARMHPILDLRRPHRGVDIVAPFGSPILASARGRVSFVGYSGAYGLTIEVDHGHGILTRYAHSSRALVRPGQQVARGDTIGRVGRSGLAVGSHLHYEVLVDGEPKDPRGFIFDHSGRSD